MKNLNVAPTCWLRPSVQRRVTVGDGIVPVLVMERKISGHNIGAQHYLSILECLNVGMCRFSCAIHYWKTTYYRVLPITASPHRWLPAPIKVIDSFASAQEYIPVTLKINAHVLPEPCSIIFAVHFKVVPHVSFLTFATIRVMGDEIHGTCMLIPSTLLLH
jgi:hypothetical protein